MPTRMLVPRKLYDQAIEIAAPGFENFPYGDPTDPSMMQGPQISAKQRDRVLGYIEKGKEEGARVVVGGGRPGSSTRATSSSRRSSPTSTTR